MRTLLFLFLALAPVSCTLGSSDEGTPSGPAPGTPVTDGLEGNWIEILPEGVVYFEGSKLGVRVFPDSAGGRMLIDERHWTDVAICMLNPDGSQTCSDFVSRFNYDATYRFQDSLLVLDYRRLDHPDGPVNRTEFRVTSLAGMRLGLKVVGEKPFIGNKHELVLEQVVIYEAP